MPKGKEKKSKKATSSSRESWRLLDDKEKFAIAYHVSTRRRAALKKYPNVQAVGVGFRMKRGRSAPVREICIRFFVKRKWHTERSRPGYIPNLIPAFYGKGKKRKKYLIPTDVDVIGKGRLMSSLDLTSGIKVRNQNNTLIGSGSVCCLVKEKNGLDKYLLSCRHVLGIPDENSPENKKVFAGESDVQIGVVCHAAPMGQLSNGGLDAAISTFDRSETQIRVWSSSPNDIADITDLINPGMNLYVYGKEKIIKSDGSVIKRKGPLRAKFVTIIGEHCFNYGYGKYVNIVRSIQYLSSTEPGDSGSALLTAEGNLLGMHFFEDHSGYSYAMLAEDLFDETLFGRDLSLA